MFSRQAATATTPPKIKVSWKAALWAWLATAVFIPVMCIFRTADVDPTAVAPLTFEEVAGKQSVLSQYDIPELLTVSDRSAPYFDTHYKDMPFLAEGVFNEINSDMGTYNIGIASTNYTGRSFDIACRTTNDGVVDYAKDIKPGTPVKVVGAIKTTWMGTVQLVRCQIAKIG